MMGSEGFYINFVKLHMTSNTKVKCERFIKLKITVLSVLHNNHVTNMLFAGPGAHCAGWTQGRSALWELVADLLWVLNFAGQTAKFGSYMEMARWVIV